MVCADLRCISSLVFKLWTAYDMLISDWSSDMCSSNLRLDRQILVCLLRERREDRRLDRAALGIAAQLARIVIAQLEPADHLRGAADEPHVGGTGGGARLAHQDRKSTRLNSSH